MTESTRYPLSVEGWYVRYHAPTGNYAVFNNNTWVSVVHSLAEAETVAKGVVAATKQDEIESLKKIRFQALAMGLFLTSYDRETDIYCKFPLFWDMMMSHGYRLLKALGVEPDVNDREWYWQLSKLMEAEPQNNSGEAS